MLGTILLVVVSFVLLPWLGYKALPKPKPKIPDWIHVDYPPSEEESSRNGSA